MIGVGEAARALNVPAHTLHHWEHVGALVPARTVAGHRRYDDEHLDSGRFILRCQRAGFSLAKIVELLHGSDVEQRHLIEQRVAALDEAVREATQLRAWLSHRASCQVGTQGHCSECAALAASVCPDGAAGCDDVLAEPAERAAL